MITVPFSQVLKEAMSDQNITAAKLEELLKDRGIDNITFRRISEYLREVTTPGFEKAKNILETLGFDVDNDELSQQLALNRELIKENNKSSEFLKTEQARIKTVRIRMNKIIPGNDPQENVKILNKHLIELYGDTNMTKYVEHLIYEDLTK